MRVLSSCFLVFLCLVIGAIWQAGCGDDDESSASSGQANDDDTVPGDDDNNDDDVSPNGDDDDDDDNDNDNDDNNDDNDDATGEPTPAPNPTAKADAFKLFYKERSLRTNLSVNRFALSGDAVAANAFGLAAVAKEGAQWEVVAGPEGNNPFGKSLWATWKLYQAIGGRDLELSLIRMFEGVVFNEAVSGHSGLTTREAFPGWTRVMDGPSGSVTRTRWGEAVTPPVTYSAELEVEILARFYADATFTYRENPEECLFNMKAVHELTNFAITYVFDELEDEPPFLRISDCCSSMMVSQKGVWEGAYWGNHNSRDNFTDLAMGFLAAFEAENATDLPADLTAAAHHAAEAARRTGDNIVAHDNVLMTVDEWHDYETLTPAGTMNPDGEVEWQDLGSLASCQMAYVAHAVSTAGLDWPVPETPLPGSIEMAALRELFRQLGLTPPELPVLNCRSLDDAFIGMTWGEMLELEIFGIPLWDVAEMIAALFPDLFPDLLGGMMDDFSELMLGAVVLCHYARIEQKDDLYEAARQTLKHFVELQKILAQLVYGVAADPRVRAVNGNEAVARTVKDADTMLYKGAAFARMFGIDSPLDYFNGFARGEEATAYYEGWLDLEDTTAWALLSDEEIAAQIEARLTAVYERAPWRVERYRARFGDTYPVRRAGDGYECVGTDDQWQATENPRHATFNTGERELWFEATLCVEAPETLDCAWAKSGCAPADLDGSGTVDEADAVLFEAAWEVYGSGAACAAENDWCDGADTDRDGQLTQEDRDYLAAATGCVV